MFAKRNVNRLFKRSLTIVKCDAVRFPCMKESTNKKNPQVFRKMSLTYILKEKIKSNQVNVKFFFFLMKANFCSWSHNLLVQ